MSGKCHRVSDFELGLKDESEIARPTERGIYQAEGATYAKTWGGWVTAGRIICHSALRGTARRKSKEGSRIPRGRELVKQF